MKTDQPNLGHNEYSTSKRCSARLLDRDRPTFRLLYSGIRSIAQGLHPEPVRIILDMSDIQVTTRTKLGRLPDRGSHDREVINAILDEGFICHVGFELDGQPFVAPTGYGRQGHHIYFHGSAASRMLRNLSAGVRVCVTVTLVDALVLARSIFHHSMNYRSVMVLGTATLIEDRGEKLEALRVISDNLIHGRWDEVRQPTEQELKATAVMKVPIKEASAKIRTGPPKDDTEDYDLPIWAGVLPLITRAQQPVIDPAMRMKADLPASVKKYGRG